MKLKTIPDISTEMDSVQKQYLNSGADFKTGIELINAFLKKYPYYSEAYIFKSTVLITKSRYKEALNCIKIAKKIDIWRVFYCFNEAEILYNHGKDLHSCALALDHGLNSFANDIITGIDNLLIAIIDDDDERSKLFNTLIVSFTNYLSNKMNANCTKEDNTSKNVFSSIDILKKFIQNSHKLEEL